jgi:hypothetical protein
MPASPADLAERAAAAIHDLTLLTRPAITSLDTSDLHTITGALTQMTTALPQLLRQLSSYHEHNTTPHPMAAELRACLQHASAAATHLSTALDTAHQILGNHAETITTQTNGVNIQPAIRGQISSGVDTLVNDTRQPRMRTVEEVYGSAFAEEEAFQAELNRSLAPRGFDLMFELVAALDLPPGSVALDVGAVRPTTASSCHAGSGSPCVESIRCAVISRERLALWLPSRPPSLTSQPGSAWTLALPSGWTGRTAAST